MKRWQKVIQFFFLILPLLVIIRVTAKEAESIHFVHFNDYPPFGWEENGVMHGIYIDIINEVFVNRLGIPVEHNGFPWKRAQKMVSKKLADGFCTVITPERLEFSDPTQHSIIEVDFKIYTPKDSPQLNHLKQISSLSELKGIKLVDYAGSGWAIKNLQNAGIEVHWLQRNEQIWRFLLAGRADATVNNEWIARYSLKNEGYQDKFLELPQTMTPEPISFHIFIGKKSSFHSSLQHVDEQLKKMKEDGTIERIYEQYR